MWLSYETHKYVVWGKKKYKFLNIKSKQCHVLNRPPTYKTRIVTYNKTHRLSLLYLKFLERRHRSSFTQQKDGRGVGISKTVFEVQPPSSPELSPSYIYFFFNLWQHLNPPVYSAPTENEETDTSPTHFLMPVKSFAIHHLPRTFETVQQCMIRRLHACTDSGGDTFWTSAVNCDFIYDKNSTLNSIWNVPVLLTYYLGRKYIIRVYIV